MQGMKLSIAQEKNPERLKQVIRLYEVENRQLHARLQDIQTELDRLKQTDSKSLQRELELLQRQVNDAALQSGNGGSQRRGRRTRPPVPPGKKLKPAGGRRTIQTELELEVRHVGFGEDEMVCPHCGGLRHELAGVYESSEVIEVVERRFIVVRVDLQKYGCDGGCTVATVPAPVGLKLQARGRYSLSFAVTVAIAHFQYHQPYAAQAKQMRAQGLAIEPNTLCDQTYALSELLRPSYDALRLWILENQDAIGTDVTGWPLLEKGNRKYKLHVLNSPQATFLSIQRRKDHQTVLELLTHPERGVFTGTLVTDGAAEYQRARLEVDGAFQLAACWSHIRSRLFKIAPDYPEAVAALDLIDGLFGIESSIRGSPDLTGEALLAEIARRRNTESRAVVDKIRRWMNTTATGWDGSSLNAAIRHMDDRWTELILFLERPEVWIHNNGSEFDLRRPVLGRRNWGGSRAKSGMRVAELFWSLIETCRRAGVDPDEYLKVAARRAIESPGAVTLPFDLINK